MHQVHQKALKHIRVESGEALNSSLTSFFPREKILGVHFRFRIILVECMVWKSGSFLKTINISIRQAKLLLPTLITPLPNKNNGFEV